MNRIRLACLECDRNDYDGVDSLPDGWEHVTEEQTYEQACAVYDDPWEAPPGYDVWKWWTHIGTCPECQE